ncbi:MAG: 50S ribosomal protein L15 [Candidatus Moranbacteria bacterium]|nr:50S ribosomal protein L15 [Candidatus Moranbacteria bacterium]
MQIHELKTKDRKTSKRIGRGGCRGTYSGRGMNGQKSRSGGNVDPLFEGGRPSLIQRMKKLRGFKSIHPKKNVITLSDLENNFSEEETVSPISLMEKKMVRKRYLRDGIKVVATGELSKKLVFSGDILLSKGARESIEKAGGKILEA